MTSGDWIIFEFADKEMRCNPKWLKINQFVLNGLTLFLNGLKSIRLFFQYSGSNGWANEQKIQNIHNKNANDQWFKLDEIEQEDRLELIKLVIDNNHGDGECSSFYSFVLTEKN